ncbi:MAG: DUF3859 domain-containing protein [Cytophagaceae bacterium]
MKGLITIIGSFLFSISVIAQTSNSLQVKELNYGKSTVQKLYETKMKKSPSGHHNITAEKLNIVKRTDTIEAKIGEQFGIEYELISKKNETIKIQITWLFPEGMKDQNGKEIRKLTYEIPKNTNEYTYSNYTLEDENEVVKGQWVFIISKGGKELYRKSFWLN